VNLTLNIAQQSYRSGCILSMMSHKAIFPMLILCAGVTLLHAQAIVEFGTLTGRSTGAASGAGNVGKSIADVFGKVNQSMTGAGAVDAAAKPKPLPAGTTAPATAAAKPEPATPPNLSALAAGMDRADMVKKVGKPWMSITSVEDSILVETCSYRSGSDTVTVTLRDGKVATISGVENLAAKQALAPVHDPVSH
jgi:hypothetical protein